MSNSSPSIALVYDRVNTPHGGAEKVLLALHQLYPDAPLYTSVYDPTQAQWAHVFDIRTSFLQRWPGAQSQHRWLVPFMPLAFESFDLSQFDIVISITSAEAKGVLTKPHQLHICYVLTPTRYLYSHEAEYAAHQPLPVGLSFIFKIVWQYLKWWDQAAAARPDLLIPISKLVAYRTTEFYGRLTAPVVYPPVIASNANDQKTALTHSILKKVPDHYFLMSTRLVPYKKVDVAIQACRHLGRDLVIVGDGPDRKRLQKIADSTPGKSAVLFLGHRPQAELTALYTRATGLLMPGEEDFGMASVEAVAHGVPVIVHHQSGAAELLVEDETAIFITEATMPHLVEAIHLLETGRFNRQQIKQTMKKYATTEFLAAFKKGVDQAWTDHRRHYSEKGRLL